MEFDARKEIKLIIEKWLKDTLKKSDIKENDNLIEKGLSSMQVMQLSGILKKEGLRISFAKLIEKPTLNSWFDLVANSKIIKKHSKDNKKSNDGKDSFNLTDVQYSYFIGRSDDQTLGGVGCHAYIEIDGKDIDYKRLNDAWNILQYRHPMLRARFTEDGKQEILDKPFSEEIEVFDLSNLDDEETKIRLDEIRENLSHRKFRVEIGEVAGLKLTNLSHNRNKIFFDLDLLVADVMSMSILLKELGELYLGKELDNLNNYTFKDYINNLEVDSEIYKKDQEFWKEKIDSFEIERPNLPLKKAPEQIKETRFTRRKRVIEKDKWSKIKELAASYKSTPSMVLLTAYALILERWTNQDKFFINLPLFNRDLSNENLKDMVADFTNILLVEHERKNDTSFLETLNRISETFIDNASHSSYSGVQVQRDISKSQGTSLNVAPVVFACNIDYPLETETSSKALGRITYMVSQTPGVWLDFQSYIKDGDLVLCWDSVDELFPEKMLDDMLNSLEEQLLRLTEKGNWKEKFDVLPKNQKQAREKELQSILPLNFPDERLYDGFIKNVKENPEKIAIIDSESKEEISYIDLYEKSLKIAGFLKENGIKKGDYVGITLPRSSKQIYAIFGILFSGAAYVAVGINQPSERRTKIYEQIGIKFVISENKTIENCKLDTGEVSLIDLDKTIDKSLGLDKPIEVSPFDSAYIIMTSGTTGVPKGVEIMHTSAINTINDLNEKYSINSNDTLLMVSAIDFDLSVYDIFGILGVGGTLITNNEDNYRNPDEWIRIIEKYKVSVWDSVPILFDMLVTMAEGEKKNLPLRIVMLSGDWIAKDLPGRFYKISEKENSIVVAMGGATEASIWSNYLNVPREIPKDWISIPYGKPLKNQVYRVVDELGRICPNYVKGELLIGGVGVAKCYHGDEDLTNRKYFEEDGLRWYRTGDNGRFWNDGTIEFLGRKDTQVKIKGHRIELGEIENALNLFDCVNKSVALVIKDGNINKLIGFVEGIADEEFNQKSVSIPDGNEEISQKYAYESFINELDSSVDRIILNIIKECKIFADGNCVTYEEIISKINPADSLKNVIKLWISNLCKKEIILKSSKDTYCLNKSNYDNFEKIKNIGIENNNSKLNEILLLINSNLLGIIQGKINPIEFFYHDYPLLSPVNLSKMLPWYNKVIEYILDYMQKDMDYNQKNIIFDYDSRDDLISERISSISNNNMHFYFDKSLNKLKQISGDFSAKSLHENDIESFHRTVQYVLAFNSIHRDINVKESLNELKNLLTYDGKIIMVEPKKRLGIQDITTSILNNFAGYDDSVISIDEWNNLFSDSGLRCIKQGSIGESMIYILELKKSSADPEFIKEELKRKVPIYMVPDDIVFIENMPQNKNGKIDRKQLEEKYIYREISSPNFSENLRQKELEEIRNLWIEVFEKHITTGTNFFSSGGDSLIATRLATKIENNYGIKFSIKDVMENITIESQAKIVKDRLKGHNFVDKISVMEDTLNGEEFDLTEVQQAYYIGRNEDMILGGVSTHCYFEIESMNIDVDKLEQAWNHLIDIHPMLRAVITDNGKQKILSDVPYYKIMTSVDSEVAIRNSMSQQVLNINQWPVFDIRISQHESKADIIHISFDNIILDGWSMFYVLEQWSNIYKYGKEDYKASNSTFRKYVDYSNKLKNTQKYSEDKEYWLKRVDGFLKAPIINNYQNNPITKGTKFIRREAYIEPIKWEAIKDIASKNNLTITSLLIGVYAEAIREVSENENFTINVTRFNRPQIDKEINEILGDFTTLLLLEIDNAKYKKLLDRFKEIQKRLINDLNHELFSGIEMQKELRKVETDKLVLMPIVFTSGIGINSWDDDKSLGKIVYGLSQTPQVFLDNQALVYNDGLKIYWDSIDEVLGKKNLDVMFEKYVNILNEIADNSFDEESTVMRTRKYNDKYFSVNNTSKQAEEIEKIGNGDFDIEKEMKGIWEEILNTSVENNHCKFFEAGGDSLKAIQLRNKIQEVFLVDIDLLDIFKNPSIKELSAIVTKGKGSIVEGSL
ncbi:AMP-binding enzyme [Anaerococcus lactolyticus ATCC 51172]|uniref:AMP-binding enzyme n=1 Tax=Anaerococcus lactolyticus ATCC 51172 TaxID=525254 RepID=C2BGI5_9FIRM|nr:non-ribosomal peptide synthetase [Anaerococcus lactolyticus]EEI85965.1 AMP-binding enzyme [Anaerococcus lactolyticus ATCC 51172]